MKTKLFWLFNFLALFCILIAPIGSQFNDIIPFSDFLLLTIGFLLLICLLYIKRKNISKIIKKRSFLYSSNALLSNVILFLIILVIGYFLSRYDKKLDLTFNKRFTLLTETKQVLDLIKEELTITGFYKKSESDSFFLLFNPLKEYQSQIQLVHIDPISKPHLTQKYQIRQTKSVIFSYQNFSTTITNPNIQKITTAILKVLKQEEKELFFIVSPETRQFPKDLSQLKIMLTHSNYKIKLVSINNLNQVPLKSGNILIFSRINAPYTKKQLNQIQNLLKHGGKSIFLIDSGVNSGLEPLLLSYGIRLNPKDIIVLDPKSKLAQYQKGNYLLISGNKASSHSITKDLYSSLLFYKARSLQETTTDSRTNTTVLVKSTKSTWANLNGLTKELSLDNTDIKGPLPLAILSEKKNNSIIVVGDSDFITNSFLNNLPNGSFILNMVNYLNEHYDLINITPRPNKKTSISLPLRMRSVFFYLLVIIIPIIILGTGWVRWFNRSRL